jgi:O-antigen ligase
LRHLLERFGGLIPSLVALTLPVASIPIASDSYILPRASIVIAGACLGLGLGVLLPERSGLGSLRWPLVAAAAAALLAAAFSISWPLSLAGAYTRYESMPMRLAYVGLAASTVWLLRTARQRELVGTAFVLGTTVVAFKAWLQWFNHAPFRPDGDLGNANLLAALIVMAIPIAIDRGRRANLLTFLWALEIVVLIAGLVVTTSRSGALGLVAGCAVWLTLTVPKRWVVPIGAGAGVSLLVALGFVLLSPLRTLNDDPPELRFNLWADALRLIAARPLTGWGEDSTGLAFGHFLSRDYAGLVTFDRVHSGPLEIAATQGILGVAALGSVLVVLGIAAWRGRSEPGVAGLAGALAGYSVWVCFNFDWAPATGAFWLLLGTMWSLSSAHAAALEPLSLPRTSWGPLAEGEGGVALREAPGRRAAYIFRASLAASLVLVATGLAVLPILADVWYLKGRADLAVRADPLQAQYHWSLGQGLVAKGDLRGGIAELRRAGDLGETEPSLYVELGDRLADSGDAQAAHSAYRRALEIDPYYTPARSRLAALPS